MTDTDPKRLSEQIKGRIRDAIASTVAVGQELAEARKLLGHHFDGWCIEACHTPLAEAELLIRYAAARPAWVNPAGVDIEDDLAPEIFELAIDRTERQLPEVVKR